MSLLRSLGIVKVIRYKAKQWNQTNYYTLDYDRLHEFLGTESSSTEEVKNAETTETVELCNNTAQAEGNLTLEVREPSKSYIDSKKTSVEDQTAKQTVAASPENEELNALGEPEAKLSQPRVNGLGEDKKA